MVFLCFFVPYGTAYCGVKQMQNVHFNLNKMLRYSSDENFLLILNFSDRWISCVNIMRILKILCKIRANACIPHVMRINIVQAGFSRFFFLFFVFLQFSFSIFLSHPVVGLAPLPPHLPHPTPPTPPFYAPYFKILLQILLGHGS